MTFTSTSPENAADIEAMRDILAELSVGATVTYAEIAGRIGRDPTHRPWLLRRAMRDAEEDTGSLFEIVRGEGVKRLPTSEIANVGTSAIRKVRKAAKRATKRLSCVRANDLAPEDAARVLAVRSQLGAISLVADGRKTQAVAAKVDGGVIPAARALELFKG
jgi:hypothetical protein